MTIEKVKFCVRCSACRGSPRSISLACFKHEEQTKLMYFSFSNDNCSSAAWMADVVSQASLRDVRQYCWIRGSGDGQRKDNTVGNVVAKTGRDCGTTARVSDLSMPFQLCASPLKGEVRRSPKLPARPSGAANCEKRQICTTCLFVDSVGL